MSLKWNEKELSRLFTSPSGPVAKDLTRKALQVEREVKLNVKAHGRGRIYKKSNPRRTHQASAPGDPPATDLGGYGASITHAIGQDAQGLLSWVGTKDKRGPWLERGTIRMAPRQHFRPALQVLRRR